MRIGIASLAFAAYAVIALPPESLAHGLGTSQIHLRLEDARLEGEWDLDPRDAARVVGLVPGRSAADSWRHLRPREAELRSRMAEALTLAADGVPCAVTLDDASMSWHPGEDFVRVRVTALCHGVPRRLTLGSRLLFDLDPAHRTYFSVADARTTSAGVLRATLRSATFDVRRFDAGAIAAEFLREGVGIWSGLDHLLLLFALLLPAPLIRSGGAWSPRPDLGAAARQVVRVVTAFTFAHSLTMVLSFYGVLVPPSRWVETVIALSVFAAAWNNLRPFLPGRGWAIALGFGLVHGLGFAGALKNLALPRRAAGLALGAFNVGVELGQLAIVAAALPVLYLASRRAAYPRWGLGAGSLLIAWMALVWSLERGFSLRLFPGF